MPFGSSNLPGAGPVSPDFVSVPCDAAAAMACHLPPLQWQRAMRPFYKQTSGANTQRNFNVKQTQI